MITMQRKQLKASVNLRHCAYQCAVIVLLILLFSLWLVPLTAYADVDPGDDYWLKLNRTHPVIVATDPGVTSPATVSPPSIPITSATSTVVSTISYPSWIPLLSPAARTLYQRSLATGHDKRLFTIAGDSNSHPMRYLGRVTSGAFPLPKVLELQSVVGDYVPSFTHISIATGGGFRAADMFDAVHANGFGACHKDEGMFACELRSSNASIVFIQLGTGDKFVWRDFERNYRAMLDYATQNNVLPILVTKADDIESLQGGASYGYINGVIRALAVEYQMPLLDLYAATRDLPVIPNPDLPKRPYTQYGLQDEWGYYFHLNDIGQDRHILITLETLARIGK